MISNVIFSPNSSSSNLSNGAKKALGVGTVLIQVRVAGAQAYEQVTECAKGILTIIPNGGVSTEAVYNWAANIFDNNSSGKIANASCGYIKQAAINLIDYLGLCLNGTQATGDLPENSVDVFSETDRLIDGTPYMTLNITINNVAGSVLNSLPACVNTTDGQIFARKLDHDWKESIDHEQQIKVLIIYFVIGLAFVTICIGGWITKSKHNKDEKMPLINGDDNQGAQV